MMLNRRDVLKTLSLGFVGVTTSPIHKVLNPQGLRKYKKNIEGKSKDQQIVIGWKAWYVDGSKYGGLTIDDFRELPKDGLLILMLYYNWFSVDGTIRYKRVMMGNDYYFMSPDEPDNIYGHNDHGETDILHRYPNAIIIRGIWTNDENMKRVTDLAMDDYNVSELGIEPEPNTTDK